MPDEDDLHARELEFNSFIEELRSYTEIPTTLCRGEIAVRAANFACQGCGKGQDCVDPHEPQCYECESCYAGNYYECPNKRSCDDCFWCGCDNCRSNPDDYDGSDRYPAQEYRYRVKRYLGKMVSTLKELPIPFDQWTPYIDDTYLNDTEKKYLRNILNPPPPPPPRSYEEIPGIRPYATNYNILRIMAGLPGLDYRD